MPDQPALRRKPEEEELARKKQELSALESELAERELQLSDLKNELATFERLYLITVGVLYSELDEIAAQIAALHARQQPNDKSARDVAQQAQEKAEQSKQAVSDALKEEVQHKAATQELKNLYREVAKKIHPDLATDPEDRELRKRLMAEANRAYQDGNEAKLRAILLEYEASPEAVKGDGAGAELVRVIRKIAQVRRRLTEIDESFKQIVAEDLFELKKKVDEGKKLGRDVLNEMASSIQSQIAERQAELRKARERGKK